MFSNAPKRLGFSVFGHRHPAAENSFFFITESFPGLCYVGNLNKDSLLYFIIIPLMTYLAVGALALGAGFCSLLKIRRVMRKTGDDSVRLEKLILKIGIFTLLYILPTSCVLAINIIQVGPAATTWRSLIKVIFRDGLELLLSYVSPLLAEKNWFLVFPVQQC